MTLCESTVAKRKFQPTPWQVLAQLIETYADARVADSWKGGGDPAEAPVFEADLAAARERLNYQLLKMERDDEQ